MCHPPCFHRAILLRSAATSSWVGQVTWMEDQKPTLSVVLRFPPLSRWRVLRISEMCLTASWS